MPWASTMIAFLYDRQGIHMRFENDSHRNTGGYRHGMSSGIALNYVPHQKKNTNKSNASTRLPAEHRL
jgi:hypothetical protein